MVAIRAKRQFGWKSNLVLFGKNKPNPFAGPDSGSDNHFVCDTKDFPFYISDRCKISFSYSVRLDKIIVF